MYTSKLFAVLRSFEVIEWKGFLNFLSLYGSSTKDTAKLYRHIYSYRSDLNNPKLQATETRKKLFAHLGEKSFRNILSKLHRIVEDYLVWQRVTQNRSLYDLQLFEELDDRGLDSQANKVADRINATVHNSGTIGFYQFYTMHKIAHEHYFSDNPVKYTQGKELLFDAYLYLQQYQSSVEKLYEMEMYNMSKVMNQDWLAEFEKLRKNRVPSKVEETLSALHRMKTALKFNEKDYLYLKNQLTETNYDRVMSMAIYIYLDHSLKRRSSKVNQETERFELMKEAIDKDLFLDKGTISAPRFWNCINLACKLREFSWVQEFIEENHIKLAPRDKELMALVNATLAFHKKNYVSCYRIISVHRLSNPRWEIILLKLKLRCLIELGEEPSNIIEEIKITQNFLKNNRRNMSDDQYTRSNNYCSAVGFILQGNTKNLSLLIKNELISQSAWINEKLEELKSMEYVGDYKST